MTEGDEQNAAKVIEIIDRKRALLLHLVGERTYDIYEAQKRVTETTYPSTKDSVNGLFFYPGKTHKLKYTIPGATNRENVSHLTNLSQNYES